MKINKTEIKHQQNSKISKFTLKRHAFVYNQLINFPVSNIAFEKITAIILFENVNRIIKIKIHAHHSHVTGEILGYVHYFCHWRLCENKTEFVCFADNFFSFDMCFLIQGFRASAWNTKDFNIGGTGLKNISFTNISSKTKFIDILKYYKKV